MSGPLTLRRRGAKLIGSWQASFVFVAIVVVAIGLQVAALGLDNLRDIVNGLAGEEGESLLFLFAIAVGGLFLGPLIFKVGMSGRIEIRDSGIAFRSEQPELLQFMQPDWDYTWSQIQEATLPRPMLSNPLLRQLKFTAGGRTLTLVPWQWVDANNDSGSLSELFGTANKSGAELERLVMQTPLITTFEQRGKLDADHPAGTSPRSGSIDSSRAAQAVAVLFVGLVLYFILDMYFGFGEHYAGAVPWHLFATVAVCGLGLAATVLHIAGHLSSQGKLIAMLFGLGTGLASYPFLLRVNAWTDPVGLQSYEYTLGERDTWVAEADVPDLVFDIGTSYWDQFEPGDMKSFELRRGGLSFYQINMQLVYAEQRAFYESQ